MSYDPRYDDAPRRGPRPNSGPGVFTSLVLVGVGALIAAAIIAAAGYFRARQDVPLTNPDARPREATPAAPLDFDEREAVDLFKKLKPSVVNVDIVQRRRTGWDDRVAEVAAGTGSGFIWDDDGRIVTNYHVIAEVLRRPDVLTARVVLADRTAYDAVVVGVAEDYDLAVLQFAPHNPPPKDRLRKIELGTSGDLEVGQKVYAIGNPLGLSLTMTKGIISALDRPLRSPANTTIPGVIQTDAAINPGNSGGPLLDKTGRLIGVNTAIATTTEGGGNIGIGFAIPADRVNEVVTEIVKHGRILRPDLGIKLYDQVKLRRARYDHGVMIDTVLPNGPAARAGLHGVRANPRTGRVEPGDLIVAINAEPIDTVEDYERVLRTLKPGAEAKLKVVRVEWAEDGARKVPKEVEKEVSVTVGGA